jgi:hypothetical protein
VFRTLSGVVALAVSGGAALAGEVSFAAKPAVMRDGGQAKVAFTLSAPADVEVAVVDAQGKVVRHLAAGVLGGPNAPPQPLQPGLAQELAWDGKNDLGASATGGPFRFRVRAGMSVKFGRMLGGSPYTGALTTGAPSDSLAVDQDGTLYAKLGSFVPQLHEYLPWQVRKFDRNGRYLKTILPWPASTPPEKASGFTLIDAGRSTITPANMTPLDPVFFHFGDNLYRRVVDGSLVFVDGDRARLVFVRLDGSNALKTVPMRSSPNVLKWPNWLSPQVAFSPDGTYAYYSNVAATPYDGKSPADIPAAWPQGRIYRHDLRRPGADPERFFDLVLPDWNTTKYWMPSAWDKKTAAAGIDVDPKGNVFVGDLVNQEVVEIAPDGTKRSATKVPWPDKVLVNGKDGSLYVVSRAVSRGAVPPADLLKVVGRGAAAKVAARLPLKGNLGQCLALDDSGGVPVLWVGGGDSLIRVEDRGAELVPVGNSVLNPDRNAIGFVCYADVDPEADLVYVTQGMGPVWRYSGVSGEGGLLPIRTCDLAVGPGGLIYAWGDTGNWNGPVTRYTRDLKPAPLASGSHQYGHLACRYGRGNSVAGLDVDPRGWVFATNGGNSCQVIAYDADGRRATFDRQDTAPNDVLVTGMVDQSGSIRVDLAGNVYVLQIGRSKGIVPPKGFEKDPAYLRATGTIYQFGPQGGAFEKGAPVGALRAYSTPCAPISGNWASTQSVCHCTKPRFEVDAFGRLYVPNAFTNQVTLRDNADNEVLSFGAYGNFDDAGVEDASPSPAARGGVTPAYIPLGWPITAGASDRFIYVGDCLNHRIVRVDKTWAVEANVE